MELCYSHYASILPSSRVLKTPIHTLSLSPSYVTGTPPLHLEDPATIRLSHQANLSSIHTDPLLGVIQGLLLDSRAMALNHNFHYMACSKKLINNQIPKGFIFYELGVYKLAIHSRHSLSPARIHYFSWFPLENCPSPNSDHMAQWK